MAWIQIVPEDKIDGTGSEEIDGPYVLPPCVRVYGLDGAQYPRLILNVRIPRFIDAMVVSGVVISASHKEDAESWWQDQDVGVPFELMDDLVEMVKAVQVEEIMAS